MTTRPTVAGALVTASASPHGIRCVEHDGRSERLTYRALLSEACALGGALHALGLAPGDRVALVVPEVGMFLRAFFGITCAGLVPVPLAPPAQAGDTATFTRQSKHILEAARTSAILTSPDIAMLIDVAGIPGAPRVVMLDRLAAADPLASPVAPPIDTTALLQFTSGSTAMPKGVVLTHANLSANIDAILGSAGLHVGPDDVSVSWLPLYHDMGLIGMLLASMYAPIELVLLSPVLFLKRPSAWLEAISTYGGTISFAPNFAYDLCRRRVKAAQVASLDLSRWRIAGCGAEPIRPDTLHQFSEYFAAGGFRPESFLPSYGLAEHSLAVSFAHGGLHVDRVDGDRLVRESQALPARAAANAVRIVRCGHALPHHTIRIVDDDFRDLPERRVGSIVVAGPSVMQGYFDNVAATDATLHGKWLVTGDLGYMANGELYVCGRTKDLIIRHGRKYHPPDLESSLADLQGLALSGVVVFAVTRLEEADEVVAVLETRAGRNEDIDDLVRRRLRETAGLEIDRVVVTRPGTIPRTTSGKVRRAETRARLEAGTLIR